MNLTYNSSLAALLAKLEKEGKLFRFAPKMRHKLKRRLYLSAGAHTEFQNPQSAVNLLVPRGDIEAAMVRWVTGGRVFADLDTRKPLFLKELEPPPPDIWEIRVYERQPQARLVGAFLERDTLIVSRIHTRNFLGSKKSLAWQEAMAAALADFVGLLGIKPMRRNRVGDYISENFDDFDLNR